MEQPHGGPPTRSKALAAIAEAGTPSEQTSTPIDQWLDLLRVSCSALLRRSPSEIAAITISGALRDPSAARRLLAGCALLAPAYDLTQSVNFEGGYFRVRISRA